MNFDAFISYSHNDEVTANAACAKLEAEGIRCWIAPRDIAPSADWASSIIDAIDSCRVMVLIFSAHANQSKQVQREVQRAFERDKPVVPFRIENVTPEKSLAYYMGSVHWLDALTPPAEQHLQKLAASVGVLVGVLTPPGDVRKPPPDTAADLTSRVEERRSAEEKKREAEEEHRRKIAAKAEHQRLEREAAAMHEAKERNREKATLLARESETIRAAEETRQTEVQRKAEPTTNRASLTEEAPVLAGTESSVVQPSAPPKWRRSAVMMLCAVGVLCIGAAGYFAISGGNLKSNSPGPPTQPSTAPSVADYVSGCIFVPFANATKINTISILYDNASKTLAQSAQEKARRDQYQYITYVLRDFAELVSMVVKERDLDKVQAAVICVSSPSRDVILATLRSRQLI